MASQSHASTERDKRALLIGGVLILCVGIYFIGKNVFFGQGDADRSSAPEAADTQTGVPLLAPDVLLKKIQNGDPVALLDVRAEPAFQQGHIPQARAVPIGSLGNFSPAKDETVVIIFSESDAAVFETAKNIMSQQSFAYFFLKGGFEGWQATYAPVVSPGDPNSFIDQSKVTYIGVEAYKKLVAENTPPLFILDVQAEENFKNKHLRNAVNIPLETLENRIGEVPAGRQIVVYGENDLVSFQGGVRLSDLGIFSAQTLSGNRYLSAESGLPLEP
ncbi:MAG: hypothetical protein A2878_02030 [Candidatus Moranbacteria bacterium RIFCSPHIGHO2_01_FULL_54_31]|nr:MAG: hypothetical protein A2878_02030 [Candidatus Moranbacteria bacterium RIFCSPHIGHO2_01_FULL_54_31]